MSCVLVGVSTVTTVHDHTVATSKPLPPQQPDRGRGGVTPHWRSSSGAASSPTEMPLSGESQGGSRGAEPRLSCPGSVTAAALPAQTRLPWKRQRRPSPARSSQPQGQDVGQEGPGPQRQHAGNGPSRERTWRRERVPGSLPRGMETPGAGASPRVSQESTSAPEPCGSTSADPITD